MIMDEIETGPKIDGIEAIFMICLCLVFDAIDFGATLLDAIAGVGEFIKFFNNIIASSVLFFWVMMKGVRSTWTLAGGAMEFIPIVNALPIRTITMVCTIWLDRHPNEAAAVESVARPVFRSRGGARAAQSDLKNIDVVP